MTQNLRLSHETYDLLRCPICWSRLSHQEAGLHCINLECACFFPTIGGIPILINEKESVFRIDDFVKSQHTFFPERDWKLRAVQKLVPSIDRNMKSKHNYRLLNKLVQGQSPAPQVLVLGGSILGDGMQVLLSKALKLVETDVAFGPRTQIICDAHSLPFDDGSFDGVIAQAVLEHVVDPYRCVAEIKRVLKREGYVYAETAFMQQAHGGRYDFHRFTHLGHRRLFRDFEEVDSGAVCGPGMALAWSYQYFLLSFASSKTARAIIRGFAQSTAFFLKFFDDYLINKPGALDAASGVYFLGRKTNHTLSDRQLITLYRGALVR